MLDTHVTGYTGYTCCTGYTGHTGCTGPTGYFSGTLNTSLHITNITKTVNIETGALIVDDGVAIVDSVVIGENLTVGGKLNVNNVYQTYNVDNAGLYLITNSNTINSNIDNIIGQVIGAQIIIICS